MWNLNKSKFRLVEMPHLRKPAKIAAFLSCLEKSDQKRPDFPTFPQALIVNLAIFKVNLKIRSIENDDKALYFNILH